ncbi:MAG: hypothetical protein Q8O26_02460 [Phreatobacter sp.]|uniref:hypothetical protein n=1 Tax=Phreatobacter sp. TaxID=1966341 RepID=UPI00273652BC|nr:hypothetical protein [Phreatobacter sp.]MDP2800723.1 hypothetical protein [Phreatobacter sp.]
MSDNADTGQKMDETGSDLRQTGPGVILSAMVVLCIGLITIPVAGALVIIYSWGMLSPFDLLTLLTIDSNISEVFFIPRDLLFIVGLIFIIAFFMRASWGPPILSVLALLWAISASVATMLVPMRAMPGGLPLLTALNLAPAMIAPMLFALGFTGFLLTSDSACRWFAPPDARIAHV